MSQAASLYCVDNDCFQRLETYPESFVPARNTGKIKSFYTFEGLRYMLAKGRDLETTDLLSDLFEPSTFIGQEFDHNNVDWENEGDGFLALENARIYYHSPDAVKAIFDFLDTVTEKSFLELFNPDEMNHAGIYPNIWNRNIGNDWACNEQHILQEFHDLKHFFAGISNGTNYCLCYVG
ncbi:MAG TPA: DUF1877 family protein [Hymenobacter sp.]|jgi:hypothetical protein